jgi:hypothetical protein
MRNRVALEPVSEGKRVARLLAARQAAADAASHPATPAMRLDFGVILSGRERGH